MMKRFALAVATVLALASGSVFTAAGQDGAKAAVTYHALPPPPPFKTVAKTPEAAPPARTLAPQIAKAPPPLRACITKAEFNDAMMGTGCSCTCDEYAKKPVSPVCDVACQGHYVCWAPQITDAELQVNLSEMGMAGTMLSKDERETVRGVVRATKGAEWSDARMCEE